MEIVERLAMISLLEAINSCYHDIMLVVLEALLGELQADCSGQQGS